MKLGNDERQLFLAALALFIEGADRFLETGDLKSWPGSLRVRSVRAAPGIFEMTWSFSGPDGRATWEWTQTPDGEAAIKWRRIGGHEIFSRP